MAVKIKDCDLLERVNWVTDAVSTKDLGLSALTSYLIRHNYIHASDGRMTVGTPFPFEGEVLVPAEQFHRVLTNRPPGDFSWEFEPDRLVLKRGRFKGRIKFLPLDSWVYPVGLDGDYYDVPQELIEVFAALLPFISENATKPWATCLALIDGCAYASNNIVIARCPCAIQSGGAYLVPRWVVEFIVHRAEGLTQWRCDETSITFVWDDGSWMRSSLIVDQYPPVEKVFDTYFTTVPDIPIEEDWRETLLRVVRITNDPVVRLRVDEVRGAFGEVLSVEDGAGTPVPDGLEETIWDMRYLEAVLTTATHWNPLTYPNPAAWRGPNIEGIIAGRRD